MSETWADAQFDMLEAAYSEVPIEAKARIAELESRVECDSIDGKCSKCGKDLPEPGYTGYEYEGNYCPTCGAKVRNHKQYEPACKPKQAVDKQGDCGTAEGCASQVPESDSRERLEADILSHYKTPEEKLATVREWLDRQAVITTYEVSDSYEHVAERQSDRIFELHNKLADALEQVDSLTAERDELKAEISKYEHDCGLLFDEKNKLTADAKKWADAANEQRLVAMEQADKVQELTAERDHWIAKAEEEKANADGHWRNANKLAEERDYWKKQVGKCLDHAVNAYAPAVMEWPRAGFIVEPSELVADEFEELRKFNGEYAAENIRLQADVEEKQHVCDVQRESFRKMERELAEAKAADYTAMKDEIVKLGKQVAGLEAEKRDLCMKIYGAPF